VVVGLLLVIALLKLARAASVVFWVSLNCCCVFRVFVVLLHNFAVISFRPSSVKFLDGISAKNWQLVVLISHCLSANCSVIYLIYLDRTYYAITIV